MSNTLQQLKEQVMLLPNGDLVYEMMVTSYDLGNRNGYLEAEEKYKPVLENYQKLVELMKEELK
jgi:UTP-glucose-1-phosphate uridylyltransferase